MVVVVVVMVLNGKKKRCRKKKAMKTRSYETESGAEYNARCLLVGILLDTWA